MSTLPEDRFNLIADKSTPMLNFTRDSNQTYFQAAPRQGVGASEESGKRRKGERKKERRKEKRVEGKYVR